MSPFQTCILLLASALTASSSGNERRNLQFVTARLEGITSGEGPRSQRTTYLYKAPSPYQTPGRPVLNSFIVTSRPLELTKETHRRVIPQAEEVSTESHNGYRYLPQYKIECDSKRGSCSETITMPPTPTTPPTFKPYTTEMVERFMQDLDTDRRRNGESDALEKDGGDLRSADGESQESSKGSKATLWHRPSPYKPPEQDKKGWVALDPVPWSSSKISKWTADKHNPGGRPPEATRHPWAPPTSHHVPSSSHSQGSYTWHGPNKPHRPQDSYESSSRKPLIITDGRDPEWPSTHSQQKPVYRPEHWPDKPSEHWPDKRPESWSDKRPEHWSDKRPDQRPDYHAGYHGVNNRPQSWESNHQNDRPPHRRPQNYPTPVVYHDSPPEKPYAFGEEKRGQWVAFSDTKEYKPIGDRRSFGRSIETRARSLAKSASGRRTVRLTVLPSEGNTTTSHGGMLEVDGSLDTVDEDRRKRRQLMSANKTVNDGDVQKVTSVVIRAPVTNGRKGTGVTSASTVMAAVGAGMVPSTMAALLPLMLTQRKRRSVRFYSAPTDVRVQKVQNRRVNVKAF